MPQRNGSFFESAASPWFDVTYYRLQLAVSTSLARLQGDVVVNGTCTQGSSGPLTLDLMNWMKVDSVLLNGRTTTVFQDLASIRVTLDRTYRTGEYFSVDIFYGGTPQVTGFGSFVFGAHAGVPWVWTLSEPSGARDWWPCKDDPSDKADSADIFVTCDSSLKVGSQGRLVSSVNRFDGTTTYHWHERYPIASYLISIALTNFAQFSNWYRYSPTDSLEVLNYVLPEHLSDALIQLPKTVDMLAVYSRLFGLYPFSAEKYGHAEFGMGGAMEHQTMTSTTTFAEDVISHELAHQWFGDMITCRTWADLWLNEGFAQYSSALYREQRYGLSSYRDYMSAQMSYAVMASGAIGQPDTTSVRNLFDGNRIYAKGATVLHMLRHFLGDSVFFRCLLSYANHPLYKYATASIHDFQKVCESTAGRDLSFFFQEWIYGQGFPKYIYSWSTRAVGGSYQVTVEVDQVPSPLVFAMPIDLRFVAPGQTATATVFVDSPFQLFTVNLPFPPTDMLFDPDGWVLKNAYRGSTRPSLTFSLEQNFPNPFNPTTTLTFRLPSRSFVTLKVYDVLGREVETLVQDEMTAGFHVVDWNAGGHAAGIYFCRMLARATGGGQVGVYAETRKLNHLK